MTERVLPEDWDVRRHQAGKPRHPEEKRNEYERDCDRILYSSAFRRLAGVTQVVAASEIQLFHNRLTHTLKAAQIAKRLAQHLIRKDARGVERAGGPDPAIAEAGALAHDLGHPPFGHLAESVLDVCCKDCGLDGFEGNAQTFRIVTKLSHRDADTPGLNLTRGSLNGILKYPWLREGEKLEEFKFGAYKSEREDFDFAREGGVEQQRSIEAEIVDWADDLAYALADVEDFYRAGLIPLDRLIENRIEAAQFSLRAAANLGGTGKYDFQTKAPKAFEIISSLFQMPRPYSGSDDDRKMIHRFTNFFLDRCFSAVKLVDSPPFVRIDAGVQHEVMLLKQLTWQYVIENPSVATLQQGQRRVIGNLFEWINEWLEAAENTSKLHTLPTRLRELHSAVQQDSEAAMAYGDESRSLRARSVADYIACLTEEQALDLHARLSGTSRSSALDAWVRL